MTPESLSPVPDLDDIRRRLTALENKFHAMEVDDIRRRLTALEEKMGQQRGAPKYQHCASE